MGFEKIKLPCKSPSQHVHHFQKFLYVPSHSVYPTLVQITTDLFPVYLSSLELHIK